MALTPIDETHALQIQAGVVGRKAGHEFEETITSNINNLQYPFLIQRYVNSHVFIGNPALCLLNYIGNATGINTIITATAICTGALATTEEGKKWLSVNGAAVSRCKSDLVVTLQSNDGKCLTVGVSTKQCNNATPTNAQLFFTTARGFATLLKTNGINVSPNAITALRQFCGDKGFRPSDNPYIVNRVSDPRRYFWEEIELAGRIEWESLFTSYQNQISKLLFQKAYLDDPFIPDFLLHKTKASVHWNQTEVAIYTIDEIVSLSRNYQSFAKKSYSVNKGSYRDPSGVTHDAPRFGIIQMQRGGQKQHPEQLQFNLGAGYFYNI